MIDLMGKKLRFLEAVDALTSVNKLSNHNFYTSNDRLLVAVYRHFYGKHGACGSNPRSYLLVDIKKYNAQCVDVSIEIKADKGRFERYFHVECTMSS